jgi:hypothetical protein
MADSAELTNLDGYYIVKRFNNGWLMGSVKSNTTLFVPRKDLVRMGYLAGSIEYSSSSLGNPTAIVVPVSPTHRRRSKSVEPQKSRADQDLNWRRSKSEDTC